MTPDIQNAADMAHYTGEHEIPGIQFAAARRHLGITAWGMNVLRFAPGTEGYPVHDHQGDGQEEAYVVLSGSIMLEIDGTDHTMRAGDMVRVGPETTRRFHTTEDGAVLLAIGATPGAAYEPGPM